MRISIAKTAIIAAASLCPSSCTSYFYQVYDVSTDGLKQQDNSLVYENDDCKVLYNLWSNNGELKFAIINKTGRDIFVNMGQSFYVANGLAVDYYQGRTYTSQTYTMTAYSDSHVAGSASGRGFSWGEGLFSEDAKAIVAASGKKLVKAQLTGETRAEKEIVCIPANCFKVFNYYKVKPARVKTCVNEKDFPKKSSRIDTYTQTTTPMSFRNRIAYGFTKDDVAEKHIDNNFWISSVTNYSQKEATEDYKDKSECYGYKSHAKGKRFKIGGPDKFYKLYSKDPVNSTIFEEY